MAGDSRTEVERKKGKERKRDANDFSRHMRQRNDEGLVGSSVNGRVADRNAIRRSRREEVRQILVEPVEREDHSTTPLVPLSTFLLSTSLDNRETLS